MKKLPQLDERDARTGAEGAETADAAPYRAERLPPEDDSLELPAGVVDAAAPARVDIAAAVAAAGLVGGAAGTASADRDEGRPVPAPGSGGASRPGRARGGRGSAPSLRQRRRFARERAVQALYQWHMSGASSSEVRGQFLATQEMDRVDVDYFEAAFRGVTHAPEAVDERLASVLDRDLAEVDPIERAILRLAAWELASRADVPPAVVASEAVEIAARFCAEPGRRYVNGVVDALAASVGAGAPSGPAGAGRA